ncbi:MAG: J domain-containing protein [Synechococcales bacterium]|nr:J domain-containing protein [Synechococcales bacterium]
MPANEFSPNWLTWLSDPYAVLGLSVAADDQRVMKRYRVIAKRLHPDRYINASAGERDLATQVLAQLINPAYDQIKDEKGRKELAALMRLQARQRMKAGTSAQGDLARALIQQPLQSVDTFYEQKVTELAETQFQPIEQMVAVTQQLLELNQVYLQLKQGDTGLREKRTGLISSPTTPIPEVKVPPIEEKVAPTDYSQRHYDRAKQYAENGNWEFALKELKDALRLNPKSSDCHALLGYIYLRQNSVGTIAMAKVHIRQALKLNPNHDLAKRFAAKLDIISDSPSPASPPPGKPTAEPKKGFFGMFRK